MQFSQMALLHGKPSNDCTYTTIQQLNNVIRRGEIQPVIEACREDTHLDGQFTNLPPVYALSTRCPQLPAGGKGTTPNFNPMSYYSEVFLHAPGMPKIASEGGVGVPSKFYPHIACSLPRHTSWLPSKRQKPIWCTCYGTWTDTAAINVVFIFAVLHAIASTLLCRHLPVHRGAAQNTFGNMNRHSRCKCSFYFCSPARHNFLFSVHAFVCL